MVSGYRQGACHPLIPSQRTAVGADHRRDSDTAVDVFTLDYGVASVHARDSTSMMYAHDQHINPSHQLSEVSHCSLELYGLVDTSDTLRRPTPHTVSAARA